MNFSSLISLLILLSFIICSCQDITKTKSGIEVTYIERGQESLLPDSCVLFLNIQYVDDNGKELFSSQADGRPLALPYRAATWGISAPHAGPFYEVLATCKIQDSIQFTLTAEQLYIKTFNLDEVPKELSLSDSSKINFFIAVDSQMTETNFRQFTEQKALRDQAKFQKEEDERKILQDSLIRQYLEEQGINATRTESGLWYVIKEQGTGAKPVENDLITIHYRGSLLDGTMFDSSYEKGEPVRFAFGVRDVLKGWDEGFELLNLGGKAMFILPSHLANGSYSDGPIKPYSILRYDVELLEITKRD
ncbi:FKBP-type peptidyl-prolyl cis-trans isomerase [Reichenbachiella agarivorans]|uniref:Peptidyl-prolyl cis-trans isomerase n=1 Tax=Reichenbachiella agarivorans TaxID=2979464 RepID=A0ABY6CQ49_9BACT|nr:FKBP-type peptidyl-prolyl cis-trans isomerase [Reichenbachiella agarivorans]UXP32494.1 FKBP-type peptidyl-prolyl cis-trans isomerase [Reichenbachiella agarivorans]